MFRNLNRIAAVILIASMAALAGCSSSPLAPEPQAQQNGSTSAFSSDPNASNADLLGTVTGTTTSLLGTTTLVVSKTINGLLGGTISAGDWSVRIPAGAFSGIATVTMTVPDPSVRKVDLGIAPLVLNKFNVPVTLSCTLPTTSDLQQDVMYWWNPTTKSWTVIASTANTTRMTREAQLYHFSTYGCGKAGW